MSTCMHTGADVWLQEYAQRVHCDIHEVGETVVLNLNKDWEKEGFLQNPEKCDYRVATNTAYFNKVKGVIVVHASKLRKIEVPITVKE